MEWSLRAKIRFFALYSRLFIFALQFFSNNLIGDYEYPAKQFRWTPVPPLSQVKSVGDEIVSFFLNGLNKHEAQYHLHIANNGYVYDNTLKIFPGFPLCLKFLAQTLDNDYFHPVYSLQLISFFLNSALFIVTAEILYSLSRKILKDEYLAYKAGLFFCINPASVFFSAHYSETLYAFLVFSALYFLEKFGYGILSGIFFGLSSGVKEIGLLNSLFVVYYSMKSVAAETILFVRRRKKDKVGKNGKAEIGVSSILQNIWVRTFFPGIYNVLAACIPFATFQWFSFTSFCIKSNHKFHPDLIENGKFCVMPPLESDNVSEWCFHDPPISFFHIHSKYGTLGFDQIEDINYLPFFLLSAPVVAVICCQMYSFFSCNRRYALRLGLIDNAVLGIPKLKVLPMVLTQSLPRECFVYILHSLFLIIVTGILHPIQDLTRLLCSSTPLIYWIAALSTTPSQDSLVPIVEGKSEETIACKVERKRNLRNQHATILLQEKDCGDLGNWIKLFFLGYFLLGTAMYSNNYPWT